MVYRDISDSTSEKSSEFKYKPSLMDRFFSFLIDYLVFSPFVSFILFIFFQDSIRYWKLNPAAPEQTALTVLLGLCYFSLFSLLQALFIMKWRATPGQYFLKIQIVFENGEGLILWRAFCRQFGFWMSIFFLGVPWLALLSHPLQKTFYDRLADCRVFSRKQNSHYLSFENEGRYWQSFLATLILFGGALVVSYLAMQFREISQKTQTFKQLDKKNQFCSELKGVSQASRLQLAIAMNLVGQLSDDCLDRESDFVLWSEKAEEKSLAYYAKSLTEEDKAVESQYLTKACDQKSAEKEIGCRLASGFQTSQFEELYAFLKTQHTLLGATMAYEIGLSLDKAEERAANFAELANYDAQKIVKKYILSEIITNKPDPNSSRQPASVDEPSAETEQALDLLEAL